MTVLMTGFPGFLGSALLPGILQRTDRAAICLVQPKCRPVAHVRHCRLARSAAQLCPNCGQHVAAFGVGSAHVCGHTRSHAASASHSARPEPFVRYVWRSVRACLADHNPVRRQRHAGP